MIGYSDEESHELEAFVGLRRRVLAPTSWTAGGEAVVGAAATLPGPAAERAAASDGRTRRQPAAHLAGSAVWLRSAPCKACPPLRR
eukprot:5109162-Prymnesium_polylepis.1